MKQLVLVLAVALGAAPNAGCAHKQLTNRQVANGAITAAAIAGIVLVLLRCDDSRSDCTGR